MYPNDHSTSPQPKNDAQQPAAQPFITNQTPVSQGPPMHPTAPSSRPVEQSARPRYDQPMQRPAAIPQYGQPAPVPPTSRPTPANEEPIYIPASAAELAAQATGDQGSQPIETVQSRPNTIDTPIQSAAQPVEPTRPQYSQPTYAQNQPTYSSPFPAAPQRPAYPYQPLSPNPAPNPYWASPELPQVAEPTPVQNMPASQPGLQQSQAQARPVQSQPNPVLPPIGRQAPQSRSTVVTRQASKKKKLIIIVALVLCTLLASAVAWWYVTQIADNKETTLKKLPPITQPTEKKAPAPKPVDKTPKISSMLLATVDMAGFVEPGTVPAGYKPYDYKTPGVYAYVTEGKTCELQYGVLEAEALPGKDVTDVVVQQVAAIRVKGATASDPVKTADFSLANATDGKIMYVMDNFVVTGKLKNGKQFRSHYAVSLLKDGTRAYVLRSCNSTDAVTDEAMKQVDNFARSITVELAE